MARQTKGMRCHSHHTFLLLLILANLVRESGGFWTPPHLRCGDETHEQEECSGQTSYLCMGRHVQCGIWYRFSRFVDKVCQQCQYQHAPCQCELGDENLAIAVLRQYTEGIISSLRSAAEARDGEEDAARVPRVVVQASGGLGNQIFTIVNGLMLAVYTQRALVIQRPLAHRQTYSLDPVVDLSSILDTYRLGCRNTLKISLASEDGFLDMAMVRWQDIDLAECIVLEENMEDPYIWFINRDMADFFTENFHALHFFFLSHFAYVGIEASEAQVNLVSLPRARPWDGIRPMSDALAAIRAAGKPIIGVHFRTSIRTAKMLHWVLEEELQNSSKLVGVHDSAHARYLHVHAGYARDCCRGYEQAVQENIACIEAQVRAARSRAASAGHGGTGVIVMFASDEELVAARVIAVLSGTTPNPQPSTLTPQPSLRTQAQCSARAPFLTCPKMFQINLGCQPASLPLLGNTLNLVCPTSLTGLEGVTVVRQRPTPATELRHDLALDTALVDIELLQAASHLIGPNP